MSKNFTLKASLNESSKICDILIKLNMYLIYKKKFCLVNIYKNFINKLTFSSWYAVTAIKFNSLNVNLVLLEILLSELERQVRVNSG